MISIQPVIPQSYVRLTHDHMTQHLIRSICVELDCIADTPAAGLQDWAPAGPPMMVPPRSRARRQVHASRMVLEDHVESGRWRPKRVQRGSVSR